NLAALEGAELVNHEDAIEVIVLVLDGHGQQSIGFEFERFAMFIQSAHANTFRALDFLTYARKRQATFLPHLHAFQLRDFGIDEDTEVAGRVLFRSEERRVGEEGRPASWAPPYYK